MPHHPAWVSTLEQFPIWLTRYLRRGFGEPVVPELSHAQSPWFNLIGKRYNQPPATILPAERECDMVATLVDQRSARQSRLP